MKLAGKVAIVTGGSRGIGLAIAQALGAEGAKVAVASRTQREIDAAKARLEAAGVDVIARAADVAKLADVEALVAAVVAKWGRVDVLVNVAGVVGAIGRLEECDPAEWRAAFEVNVFGAMNACRAVLPAMRKQRSGKIVNLAGGGVGGPGVMPRWSAYTASKAAVVQFTESLARELVEDNVQVNAIAPGAVVTEMTAGVVAAGPEKAGKALHEQTLQQRQSGGESPDLAAKLVVWLASDASGALTGKMLSAKWDKVDAIDAEAANGSSLFSLRRIDGALFGALREGHK
ncbi:MAG TPA: SDR family oxidoreductase [Polyangiaceae bacterium]|jgi:3-oxoacyl-[acyl-carrier protein] reductase